MARAKKFEYKKVIQQYYAQGWEDCSEYEANASGCCVSREVLTLLKHDLAEYRLMGYPTRVIFRRERINGEAA